MRSVPDAILALFDEQLNLVIAEGGGIDEHAPGLLPGTPLADLVPPERRGEFEAHALEALVGGATRLEYRDTPGRRTWSVELGPFRPMGGEATRVVWIARDISAIKAVEA